MALRDAAVERPFLNTPNAAFLPNFGYGQFYPFAAAEEALVTSIIRHTWKDIRLVRGTITHSWGVFTDAKAFRIRHSWKVRSVRGRSITHRWRVLEAGTTEAFAEDIQLPYSVQEIETED